MTDFENRKRKGTFSTCELEAQKYIICRPKDENLERIRKWLVM